MNKAQNPIVTVAIFLAICLVCGVLLSVCNDIFYVSDDVLFARALQSIYPDYQADTTAGDAKGTLTLNSKYSSNALYGNINTVYKSTDGTYILESVGNGGFKGSVTIYVVVDKDAKIIAWSVKDFGSETYGSKVTPKFQQTAYVGKEVSTDLANEVATGATFTSNAIANGIRMASYYCMNELKLGSNPEADAMAVVLNALGSDYAGYELSGYALALNKKADGTQTVADIYGGIAYMFVGSGDNGDITAYYYNENKFLVVSGSEVVNNTGVEDATAITSKPIIEQNVGGKPVYTMILGKESVEGGTKVTVSGISNGFTPATYVLDVVVSNGTVVSIELVADGYVPGAPTQENANVLVADLVGATADSTASVFDAKHVAGATQSAYMITAAVDSALAVCGD